MTEAHDRLSEGRRAVRAGMAGLIAAIRDARPLLVTAADGLRTLDIALRASHG